MKYILQAFLICIPFLIFGEEFEIELKEFSAMEAYQNPDSITWEKLEKKENGSTERVGEVFEIPVAHWKEKIIPEELLLGTHIPDFCIREAQYRFKVIKGASCYKVTIYDCDLLIAEIENGMKKCTTITNELADSFSFLETSKIKNSNKAGERNSL